MDLSSLLLLRSCSCKTALERQHFDDVYCQYYGDDIGFEIRSTCDMLTDKGVVSKMALDLICAEMFAML